MILKLRRNFGQNGTPSHVCLANSRNKTMELHTEKFQSELHHKRRGHFRHQSTKAKCQKYDVTYHTMKHSYVLRLHSARRDASFHRNRPFSTDSWRLVRASFKAKINKLVSLARVSHVCLAVKRSLHKPACVSPPALESPVTRRTKKEHLDLAL